MRRKAIMFTRVASLHDLPPGGRILIYGAGAAGSAMADALTLIGRPACGYIDSHRSIPHAVPPIARLDEYAAVRLADDVILICSSHAMEIRAILRMHGIPALDASALAISLVGEKTRLRSMLQDGCLILARACQAPDTERIPASA